MRLSIFLFALSAATLASAVPDVDSTSTFVQPPQKADRRPVSTLCVKDTKRRIYSAAVDTYRELVPLPRGVVSNRGAARVPVDCLASPEVTYGKVSGLVDGDKGYDRNAVLKEAPEEVADQSYRIVIAPDGVTVTAGGAAGERYARATLAQLARLSDGETVPAAEIIDWPDRRWRGVAIGCERAPVSLEDAKKIVDLTAQYKMNVIRANDALRPIASYAAERGVAIQFEPNRLGCEYPVLAAPDPELILNKAHFARKGDGGKPHEGTAGIVAFNETVFAPALVAFADNSWHGRTEGREMNTGFLTRLPPNGFSELVNIQDFEDRVIAQRDKVLADDLFPFSYVRQTQYRWRVTDGAGNVLDGCYAGGLFDLDSFLANRSGSVIAETWIRSPAEQTVGAWIESGKFAEINGVKVASGNDVACTGRRTTSVCLRKGWNHIKLAMAKGGAVGNRGVFLLFEGTSARPRDVKGLLYASNEQPEGALPMSVQELLDSAKPGETVRIPAGRWQTKPFRLRSGVTLALDEGAVVYASTDIGDYSETEGQRYFIGAVGVTNAAIVGKGVFDGCGQQFNFQETLAGESQPQKLPVMMRFMRCKNLRLEGFTYRNGGAWGCHLCNCDGVVVRGLTGFNHSNRTNDGIDIESSNVLVEGCDIDADDDAIAIKSETDVDFPVTNIVIRNCRLASGCNAFKFGTGSYNAFRDVLVEGCELAPPRGSCLRGIWPQYTGDWDLTGISGIALEVCDGGSMENVTIRNVTVRGYLTPVFVRLERRHAPHGGRETYLRNVLVENVRGTAESPIASSITGVPGLRPSGITLRNCEFTFPGGGTAEDAAKPVPERETAYPDCWMFTGNLHLPAWGFYIRHADNVRFENVTLRLSGADARREIVTDDSNGFFDYRIPVPAASTASAVKRVAERSVQMLPGERWWGLCSSFGREMPFGEKSDFKCDLRASSYSHQATSLLVSDKGRAIWCEEPVEARIGGGAIRLVSDGADIVFEPSAGRNLAEAFRFASSHWFAPSGEEPELLYFTAPQLNTWIELTYNQNEKGILDYAKSMVDNGVPPGIFMIDDTWQLGYGTWEFDPRRFSNPKEMVAQLHGMGYKVLLWMCPYVSMDSPAYRLLEFGVSPDTHEKLPRGGFVMDGESGKAAAVDWWNGRSALLDLSHENGRRWFTGTLDRLMAEQGVDAFKFDGNGVEGYRGHRASIPDLPAWRQNAIYADYAQKYKGSEIRGAFGLGGKSVIVRLLDKKHTWDALNCLIPDMIAAGMVGCPFVCPDMIGGGEWMSFLPGSPFEPELFIRSAQIHALCPMMQISASPWRVLDAEYQKLFKDVVELRQKFAPRFAELARQSAKDGQPMLRCLEYEFPGQGLGNVGDEFMMGDFLLVAPQMQKGGASRTVVLPPGKWLADDGSVHMGPKTMTVDTPISRVPHFQRIK